MAKLLSSVGASIAVFRMMAKVVNGKIGSGSTARWSSRFFRLNSWLKLTFALFIARLDSDEIGHNGEDSDTL